MLSRSGLWEMTGANLARSLLSHRNSVRILLATTPMSSHLNPVIAAVCLLVAPGTTLLSRPGLLPTKMRACDARFVALPGIEHIDFTDVDAIFRDRKAPCSRHGPALASTSNTFSSRPLPHNMLAYGRYSQPLPPDLSWTIRCLAATADTTQLECCSIATALYGCPDHAVRHVFASCWRAGALARRTCQYCGINAAAHTHFRLKTVHRAPHRTAALMAHRDDPVRLKTPPPAPPNFRRASGDG